MPKNYFTPTRTCKNLDCGKNGVCVKKQSGKAVVYFCKCNANGVLQKNSCSELKKRIENSFRKSKKSVETNKPKFGVNEAKETKRLVKFSSSNKETRRNGKQPVNKRKALLKNKSSRNKNEKNPNKNKSKSKLDKFLRNKTNSKRKYSARKSSNAK